MIITEEQILRAESLLLPNGCHFDEERISFIKDFGSFDLIAVPGSGKTTALQAKLCCLEGCMPMSQGVLVLAHTNVAVDEIKKNLSAKCPKLFEYPNFVGTIQDFVDTYLAIPYYQNKYGHSISAINDSLYYETASKIVKNVNRKDKVLSYYLIKYEKQAVGVPLDINEQCDFIFKEVMSISTPKTWNGCEESNKQHIEQVLVEKKRIILEHLGILCYRDCYTLAKKFILEMPRIISVIRRQFKYIFVDETQDLKHYQIELIDKLFNCDDCVLQRIGDINQSIHSDSGGNNGLSWSPRNEHFLSNSFRLTNENAKLVNAFALQRLNGQLELNGARGLNEPIKPHLIIFNEPSKAKLKVFFEKLITDYHLQETDEGKKYGFHIIGWNAEWPEPGTSNKDRLKDIFPEYSKKEKSESAKLTTLSEYIQLGRKSNISKYALKSVYNIICEFARLNNYQYNGRLLNQNTIKKWISQLSDTDRHNFDLVISKALNFIAKEDYANAYLFLKEQLNGFILRLLGKCRVDPSVNLFLGTNFQLLSIENDEGVALTFSLPISISTVHSVKGMTHCATLYIETSYEGKYESEHLMEKKRSVYNPNPLFFQNAGFSGVRVKEAQKMMYVGFSRPTHLLCYAMHKENIDQGEYTKEKFEEAGWIVNDLTIEQSSNTNTTQ